MSRTQSGENNPYWKGGKKELVCLTCGKGYSSYTSDRAGKYCSLECAYGGNERATTLSLMTKETWKDDEYRNSHMGENNGNWKGGNSDVIRRERSTSRYRAWRKSVLERDGHMCQSCKKTSPHVNLNAHHILSFTDFLEYRYDVENGISLCEKCHLQLRATSNSKTRGGAWQSNRIGTRAGASAPLSHSLGWPHKVRNVQRKEIGE